MEGILIRAAELEDAVALTHLYNQRRVAAGTLQLPMTAVAERHARYLQAPDHRLIVAESSGMIVGHAALKMYSGRRKHVGDIGIAVDESYQGLGVGTQMLEVLLDLADNWYNLLRVELYVFADNAAGIHLYEKLGFKLEGTHRAYAFREGCYVDAVSMARVRVESPAVIGE